MLMIISKKSDPTRHLKGLRAMARGLTVKQRDRMPKKGRETGRQGLGEEEHEGRTRKEARQEFGSQAGPQSTQPKED
jgi:hypothetical protein